MIVYISAGNSDDKLTQAAWSDLQLRLVAEVNQGAQALHGVWYSSAASPYQNMCVCAEVRDTVALKNRLADLAADFGQDSIAWAETPATEFLGSS
jgi:hypothetical protein